MIKENWFKIGILAISATLVFFIVMYINDLREFKRDEVARKEMEEIQKQEQNKKEYAERQKQHCLDIYQIESKKWNNVQGWSYDAFNDSCRITYKDPDRKTNQECENMWGSDSNTFVSQLLMCKEGNFIKIF